MPASAWKGKEWGVRHFFEFIQMYSFQNRNLIPIVLGTHRDQASSDLVSHLKMNQIPYLSMIGQLNLLETAKLFSKVRFLLSNDTGLSHLAESVGGRVFSIYGPTTPDFGFSLSSVKSEALHSGVWCAPCSKDGTLCFRVNHRYACMKDFNAERVFNRVIAHDKDST